MTGDLERIEPAKPVSWPSITRRRRDEEPRHGHETFEEPDENEDEDGGGEDEQPHIDVRV